MISSGRPGGHHLAAVDPGPGADVDDIVRGPHGVLVVLHHDQGVAQVPQVLEGGQQLVVVPLVQADGGLVQDIQHPHQGGADLRGQADALALAAGEGAGAAGSGSGSDRPTLCKKPRRARISFRICCGDQRLWVSVSVRSFDEGRGRPSRACGRIRRCSCPPTVTARASFFRRRPRQVGQGHWLMQSSSSLRDGLGLGLLVAPLHVVEDALKGLVRTCPGRRPCS